MDAYKVKKLFYVMNKLYRIKLLKGFLTLQNDEKSVMMNSGSFDESLQNSRPNDLSFLPLSLNEERDMKANKKSKVISISMMNRIFTKNMNKQLKKWYYNGVSLQRISQ